MTTQDFQRKSALRIFLSYFKPHQRLFFMDVGEGDFIPVIRSRAAHDADGAAIGHGGQDVVAGASRRVPLVHV